VNIRALGWSKVRLGIIWVILLKQSVGNRPHGLWDPIGASTKNCNVNISKTLLILFKFSVNYSEAFRSCHIPKPSLKKSRLWPKGHLGGVELTPRGLAAKVLYLFRCKARENYHQALIAQSVKH
jgi:hypothetical protein